MPSDISRLSNPSGLEAASEDESALLIPSGDKNESLPQAPVPVCGDDSIPPVQNIVACRRRSTATASTLAATSSSAGSIKQVGFATVGRTADGNVVVSWLNPDYESDHVNLASVMNRGAFCVPEYCPLSKVRYMFTRLGLRWIVVLGGASGGEVVGMVSRYNLLPSFIEESTGIAL